eukprot:3712895-Pleurochrysis_carterae.AAC.1
MGMAIKQKYVCDYRVVLPQLSVRVQGTDTTNGNVTPEHQTKVATDIDMSLPHELISSSPLVQQNPALALKCLFLANGMLEFGCSRCIVFCSRVNECVQFCDMFKTVCRLYHGVWHVFAEQIVSGTTPTMRDELLHTFQSYSSGGERFMSVLTSVRILSEGVNLVKCDSVFLSCMSTDPEGIRCIQRMCRANRIDPDRPNKVAHCFVWADDVDNTAITLHSLKYANSEDVTSVSPKSDDEDMEALASRICMLRSEYDSVSIATGGCGQETSSKASGLRAKAVLEQKITSVGCA